MTVTTKTTPDLLSHHLPGCCGFKCDGDSSSIGSSHVAQQHALDRSSRSSPHGKRSQQTRDLRSTSGNPKPPAQQRKASRFASAAVDICFMGGGSLTLRPCPTDGAAQRGLYPLPQSPRSPAATVMSAPTFSLQASTSCKMYRRGRFWVYSVPTSQQRFGSTACLPATPEPAPQGPQAPPSVQHSSEIAAAVDWPDGGTALVVAGYRRRFQEGRFRVEEYHQCQVRQADQSCCLLSLPSGDGTLSVQRIPVAAPARRPPEAMNHRVTAAAAVAEAGEVVELGQTQSAPASLLLRSPNLAQLTPHTSMEQQDIEAVGGATSPAAAAAAAAASAAAVRVAAASGSAVAAAATFLTAVAGAAGAAGAGAAEAALSTTTADAGVGVPGQGARGEGKKTGAASGVKRVGRFTVTPA